MNGCRLFKAIGAACVLTVSSGAVFADATTATSTDSVRQLQAEIEALRTENRKVQEQIARLEGEAGQTWLNERRAEEVKSLIADVLSDADTRASLLAEGMTAGHNGKNFFLASADGTFLMKIDGQLQVRYIWNSRDPGGDATVPDSFDQNEAGFQVRRAKIAFGGHIGSPKLDYKIKLAINRASNDAYAEELIVGYHLTDSLYVWAGENKAPFLREELTSSSKQLAVERSLVNEMFTVDKAQGICLEWESDMVHIAAMINDGAHSGDESGSSSYKDFGFRDASAFGGDKDFNADQVDFAISSRVDVKLAGEWGQMSDFTAWHGEPFAAFIGAGIHHQVGETGDNSLDNGGNDTITVWTVDGSIEIEGFNLFAAYVGASTSLDDISTSAESDPWAIVVQGGYQIAGIGSGILEPFVRYEHIDLDDLVDTAGGDNDEVDILTFGANYYFKKHAAKLTVDVVWAMDPLINVPGISDGLGLLKDNSEDDGDQIALRTQFQLLF